MNWRVKVLLFFKGCLLIDKWPPHKMLMPPGQGRTRLDKINFFV
jgi:hypothetical protein